MSQVAKQRFQRWLERFATGSNHGAREDLGTATRRLTKNRVAGRPESSRSSTQGSTQSEKQYCRRDSHLRVVTIA